MPVATQSSNNIATLLRTGEMRLKEAGVDNARLDVRLLLAHVLQKETSFLFGYPEYVLDDHEVVRFSDMLKRRIEREPVSKIIGYKEFWSLSFKVNQHTLDPRPDSETLITALLDNMPDQFLPLEVLDLGTGTGCLLLSVLSEFSNAKGLGIDLSDEALLVAKENAQTLELNSRADFRKGDWCEGLEVGWDVIISNPPYIRDDEKKDLAPEVMNYDPAQALFSAEEGMRDYRTLIPQAGKVLKNGGLLIIEAGLGQAEAINALMFEAGLEVLPSYNDLGGIARACVSRKSS